MACEVGRACGVAVCRHLSSRPHARVVTEPVVRSARTVRVRRLKVLAACCEVGASFSSPPHAARVGRPSHRAGPDETSGRAHGAGDARHQPRRAAARRHPRLLAHQRTAPDGRELPGSQRTQLAIISAARRRRSTALTFPPPVRPRLSSPLERSYPDAQLTRA